MRPPDQPTITRLRAERAAERFGISLEGLNERVVVGAYRRAIRAAHPDTGATPDEAAELIATVRDARRVLFQWLSEQPDASCAQCDGSGWVSSGNGRVSPCSRCV